MLVGFFGLAMIAGLMTFLDADRLDEAFAHRAAGRARTRSVDGQTKTDVRAA
ncbi:MAG: hypothetical protein ACJA14_002893 [Ilumatobacter sp.]|jgi:hypothetical protein